MGRHRDESRRQVLSPDRGGAKASPERARSVGGVHAGHVRRPRRAKANRKTLMKRSFRVPGTGGHASDVEREIENHIELLAREFEAKGMNRDDARRAAIEAFGDRAAIEDEVVDIRRETVSTRQRRDWLDELRQDIKVGVRVL